MLETRTFGESIKVVREAIQDVCELLDVEIADLDVSETKAVMEFADGSNYWFMYSYSRIERIHIIEWMVDYFLSVKRTDEEELAESEGE